MDVLLRQKVYDFVFYLRHRFPEVSILIFTTSPDDEPVSLGAELSSYVLSEHEALDAWNHGLLQVEQHYVAQRLLEDVQYWIPALRYDESTFTLSWRPDFLGQWPEYRGFLWHYRGWIQACRRTWPELTACDERLTGWGLATLTQPTTDDVNWPTTRQTQGSSWLGAHEALFRVLFAWLLNERFEARPYTRLGAVLPLFQRLSYEFYNNGNINVPDRLSEFRRDLRRIRSFCSRLWGETNHVSQLLTQLHDQYSFHAHCIEGHECSQCGMDTVDEYATEICEYCDHTGLEPMCETCHDKAKWLREQLDHLYWELPTLFIEQLITTVQTRATEEGRSTPDRVER